MGISFSPNAVIANLGQQYSFSSLVSASASAQPEYLVLVGLDRDRYPASSNGNLGTISGNGQTISFKQTPNTDCYCFGVVFTHTDKGYYNDTYGYLSDLSLKSSTDNFRNETFSLYGFGSAGSADAAMYDKLTGDIVNPFFTGDAFMHAAVGEHDDLTYTTSNFIGTLDVVTRTDGYVDATPNVATPDEIAAVAQSFVGRAWNFKGCWVLANNISAAAGASLPITSDETRVDITPPVANGEWIVAYDSANATSDEQAHWAEQLRPGDIVAVNNACGGHIMTVASGSSYAAKFIDNSSASQITDINADLVIEGGHTLPSWAIGPDPKNVTIYRLDTPVVTPTMPLCMAADASHALSSLFTVSDPAGKSIVSYQFYDTGSTGSFSLKGTTQSPHSADTALTVDASDLAAVSFVSGAAAGTDTIQVRAYNGSYWGDWQSIGVAIGSSTQAPTVHAVSDTVFLHCGSATSLASMFTESSPDAPITSYTVTMPASGGYINLNGANDLGGGQKDADGNHVYQFSAQDFAKLVYVASNYTEGANITITAHNGAAVASVPVTLTVATQAVAAQGISHWVLPGQELSLSSLFCVDPVDGMPVKFYGILTKEDVISWGDGKPSSGGTLNFHGATDLLAGVGAPIGDSEIAAADLDKLSFTAAPDEGGQFLGIYANDGGSGSPALTEITTVSTASPLTAHAASVNAGETIALSSLFSVNDGSAPAFYRIIDSTGGGAIQLSSSGANLTGLNDPSNLFIVSASDFNKLTYTGGAVNGSETITVSTSQDAFHWNAEIGAQVSTVGAKDVRSVTGGAGNDVVAGSENNDVIDGGNGLNTVVESGARDHFTVTKTASGITVTDNTGAQGTDTLTHVERIKFDDKTLAFDTDGDAGQVYRLYQAAFDRAPDAAGFGLWVRQMDAGMKLQQVADGFMQSAEFEQLYGPKVSDSDFVTHLYQNVLHRAPDAEGYKLWVDSLANGMQRETALTGFSESQENCAQVIGSIQNGMAFV
jgi:hypothetical protein